MPQLSRYRQESPVETSASLRLRSNHRTRPCGGIRNLAAWTTPSSANSGAVSPCCLRTPPFRHPSGRGGCHRYKSRFIRVVIDPPSNLPYPRRRTFMRCYSPSTRWLTVFLALLLLGAQLHFCADLAPDSSGSHICQFCATASHAVVAPALPVQLTPAVCRFETRCSHAA